MNSASTPVGAPHRIDPAPRAASLARRFVRQTLTGAKLAPEVIETVELLTSELVTNIILHAGVPGELTVRMLPTAVRVQVRDQEAALPRLRVAKEMSESGRGLVLVDAMADAWGVEPDRNGKTVWFEVGRNPT